MSDLYQTLYERNPDDFRESAIPDGYYVDDNNCLMPIPLKVAVELTKEEIDTVICGLQWSINHHKSLPDSVFDDEYDERAEILERHYRLKAMFQSKKPEVCYFPDSRNGE